MRGLLTMCRRSLTRGLPQRTGHVAPVIQRPQSGQFLASAPVIPRKPHQMKKMIDSAHFGWNSYQLRLGGDHMSPDERVAEALRQATVGPVAARELASQMLVAARAARDWRSASIALRALGVAAMQLNELDAAIADLRNAVMLGK